jgi:hypothetical protein
MSINALQLTAYSLCFAALCSGFLQQLKARVRPLATQYTT